jgi:hypothetical protein
MTGEGRIDFEDGSKFEGSLVGDVPNGYGVLTGPVLGRYEGLMA